MIGDATSLDSETVLRDRVAKLEAELAAETLRADTLLAERDRLREAYRHLELQVELQRRRERSSDRARMMACDAAGRAISARRSPDAQFS